MRNILKVFYADDILIEKKLANMLSLIKIDLIELFNILEVIKECLMYQ
jgi:hypothetical protein